jgi:preprotein translocase subunit SecF
MRDQVDALDALEAEERQAVGREVSEVLAEQTGSSVESVTVDTVGPSWGQQVSDKARTALIVFLFAIAIYITLRFELRMAIATIVALVHDLLIVLGVYSLFQFPVTPATVIAVLTILGFSIYDGIVVFDRVDENTKLLGRRSRMTYSEMANLSLNQVLMRSLNTSITALLPILTVLVLGSFVLGATTLEEFGLALFLGLLSGAYSSIFIATPLLALLKEREPRNRELRERKAQGWVAADDGAGADRRPVAAAAGTDGTAPRPRKQGRTR